MTATALIIDDEADIRELIALTLTRMGLDFHAAANLDEARNLVNNYQFDLCLTDMKLPDGNGVEFVRYIQTVQPCVPIAVITAHGNMEAAVDAMKNGAFDFVSKPVDITQLRQLVTQAVALTAKGSSAANDTAHAQPLAEQKIPSQNTSSLRSLSGREHQSEGAAGQHDVDTSERNNQSKTQLIGNTGLDNRRVGHGERADCSACP